MKLNKWKKRRRKSGYDLMADTSLDFSIELAMRSVRSENVFLCALREKQWRISKTYKYA